MDNKEIRKESRKKFLKLLGVGALSIPLMTPFVSSDMYLRKEDSSVINFNDIKQVPLSIGTAIKTSDYIILPSDDTIFVDGSENEVIITLPTAVNKNGKIYNIKCIDDTYSCWIDTTSDEEIDGDTDEFELYEDEVVTLQSDGENWRIV